MRCPIWLTLFVLVPCVLVAIDVPYTPLALPSVSSINAILICPERPERIIICIHRDVWRSDDGGVTWETFAEVISERIVPRNQGGISHYLSADTTGSVLCIGSGESWAVSRDGGRQWQDISLADLGLMPASYRPLHLVVDAGGTLYATGRSAASNEKLHLVRTSIGPARDSWTTLCTGKPEEDFTLFRAGARLGTMKMRQSSILAGSMDGGQTWSAWPTGTQLSPNGNGFRDGHQRQRLLIGHRSDRSVWLSGIILGAIRIAADGALDGSFMHHLPDWGGDYDRIRTPLPHPDHAHELFAEHLGHLARSSDGGRTWGILLTPSTPLASNGLHGWIRREGTWLLLASTPRALIALDVAGAFAPTDVSLPLITILNGAMPHGPATAVRTCYPLWICRQEDGLALIGDGVHLWRRTEADAEAQRLDIPVWPTPAMFRYPALMPQVAGTTLHIEAWSDHSPGLLSTDGGRTFAPITPPRPAPVPGWWRAGIFSGTHLASVFVPHTWDQTYPTYLSTDVGQTWTAYRHPRLRNSTTEPRPTLITKATDTALTQRSFENAFTTRDGRSWRSSGSRKEFSSPTPTQRLPDGAYLDTSEAGQRRILPRDSDTVLIDRIAQTPDQSHWLVPDFPRSTAISQRGWTVVITTDSGRTWHQRDPSVTSVLPCRVLRDEQGAPQLVNIAPDGTVHTTAITSEFIASFQLPVH